jgi:hypothetical protein
MIREYKDLDNPGPPVYRCQFFLLGCVVFAVAGITFLLASTNVNVLNLQRPSVEVYGVSETAMQLAQDLAAALPNASLRKPNLSRQFAVLAVSVVASVAVALLLSFLANFSKVLGVSRRRQMAFASQIISLGLANFGIVCIFLSIVVLAARCCGFMQTSHFLILIGVILVSLGSVPVLNHYARKKSAPLAIGSNNVARTATLYSTLGPIFVVSAVMWSAIWVSERFKPSLTVMLSESCGASDKEPCALTFMPQDIDGTVLLDGFRVRLLLGYADEANIVGPRYLKPAFGHFRVVQNPDTPLPLQVSTDLVVGVTGYIRFDCPPKMASNARKLVIVSYAAFADTRILDGENFDKPETVPLRFAYVGELTRLVRNSSNGCSLLL